MRPSYSHLTYLLIADYIKLDNLNWPDVTLCGVKSCLDVLEER